LPFIPVNERCLPDIRQKPKVLYFPGLPSQIYYGSERLPWHANLEAATEIIRK